jgi:hypothetical protein
MTHAYRVSMNYIERVADAWSCKGSFLKKRKRKKSSNIYVLTEFASFQKKCLVYWCFNLLHLPCLKANMRGKKNDVCEYMVVLHDG